MSPSSNSASPAQSKVAVMSNRHTPAVPISVYRELATELQSTKATVDALKLRNDQLMQQNRQLRQDIQQFVQFSMQLGHMVGMPPSSTHPRVEGTGEAVPVPQNAPVTQNGRTGPTPSSPKAPKPIQESGASPTPISAEDFGGPSNPVPLDFSPEFPPEFPKMRESLYTEQPATPKKALQTQPSSQRDLSALWLVLSIVVIVSTAFGAGFLIMKPLMNNR